MICTPLRCLSDVQKEEKVASKPVNSFTVTKRESTLQKFFCSVSLDAAATSSKIMELSSPLPYQVYDAGAGLLSGSSAQPRQPNQSRPVNTAKFAAKHALFQSKLLADKSGCQPHRLVRTFTITTVIGDLLHHHVPYH